MRSPLVVFAVALLALAGALAPAAAAGVGGDAPVLAQPETGGGGDVGSEEESEQREAGSGGGGAGQQNEETQTDPQQGGGGAEQGPPWTYQMSKITLGLAVLVLLGLGLLYYRLVIVRQREGI